MQLKGNAVQLKGNSFDPNHPCPANHPLPFQNFLEHRLWRSPLMSIPLACKLCGFAVSCALCWPNVTCVVVPLLKAQKDGTLLTSSCACAAGSMFLALRGNLGKQSQWTPAGEP